MRITVWWRGLQKPVWLSEYVGGRDLEPRLAGLTRLAVNVDKLYCNSACCSLVNLQKIQSLGLEKMCQGS